MDKSIVGYTGWFGWPAAYCKVLERDGDKLRVELRAGGEIWIPLSGFTPKYFYQSLPAMLDLEKNGG
jgi:hypothetical protein